MAAPARLEVSDGLLRCGGDLIANWTSPNYASLWLHGGQEDRLEDIARAMARFTWDDDLRIFVSRSGHFISDGGGWRQTEEERNLARRFLDLLRRERPSVEDDYCPVCLRHGGELERPSVEDDYCPVCLRHGDELEGGTRMIRLPCAHQVCGRCRSDMNSHRQNRCPLCRHPLCTQTNIE